jgi:hypothetical protein
VREKIWKATKLILLGLLGLVVFLIASGLIYRAWYQHRAAKILTITTPSGIDEAMFVPIGGAPQWITIRGQDRNNPVNLIADSQYPSCRGRKTSRLFNGINPALDGRSR